MKTRVRPWAFRILGVALALTLSLSTVDAQVLYGSIVGNVTDSSGGVISGASVRAVNRGTGQTVETTTNEAGIYTFQNLVAGTYDLTVSQSGFATFTQQGIALNVNTVQRHNVVLQVGQVAESVTVEASAVTLQTDRADVSAEVTNREVTDLPLPKYRNYQALINLVPGATPARFQNANTDTPARSLTTNVNGANRNNNNTKIDGTQSMLIQLPHHTAYVPGSETIEVVNITTNNFEAEQGLAGGAAVTVQTKSGTNELHGSAFAFHENSATSAKDFFFRQPKTPKSIININGFTLGGPIKKDKLFFFGGWEGTRERVNINRLYTIATVDQRRGDFSAYPTAAIYDPLSGDAQGRNRTQFANNIIPQNRLHPISLKLQELLPATNQSGVANNFFNSGTDATNRDQIDIKVNWNINPTHTMFIKYGLMDAQVSGISGIGNGGPPGGQCLCSGGAGVGDTVVNTATIGQTKTFSPTFVYDMTVGWTRMGQIVNQELRGTNYGSEVLGIPGTNGTGPNDSGMPTFTITSYSTLGDNDTWNPATRHDMTPTTTQNFSWIKGTHNVRFGFEGLQHRLNMWQPAGGGGPKGQMTFNPGITQLNGGPAATQFNSYAAFLLGLPFRYQKSIQWEDRTGYEFQLAFYIRDRWQVTPKLTFSYGVRWEKYPMFTRSAGRPGLDDWDPLTNIITLGGAGGNSKHLGVTTSNKLFAPRVGIAWRARDNLVVRTGYGIAIDPGPVAPFFNNFPISVANAFDGANSFVSYGPLDRGMPLFTGPAPGTERVEVPLTAAVTRIAPKDFGRGYTQSWNFIVEQRLPGEFVTSIGYVGTQTTRMRFQEELNYARPGGGNTGRTFFQSFGRTAVTSNLGVGLSSQYHSMQFALNRRAANGLTLKGAYTYSHAITMIEDGRGVERLYWRLPEMRDRNRADADFDQPHIFTLGFIYDLPFGPGKRMLTNGAAAKILRGWQLNGIFSAFQGRPFNVTASGTALNAPDAGTQTADLVKTTVAKVGKADEWYDRTAFAAVNRQTRTNADWGTFGRNVLHGPGVVNLDASLFRDFTLTERLKMQFRCEAFNVSNTPHFNPPNANVNDAANFMRITSTLGTSGKDAPNRSFRFALRTYW
jgi:hypothetical protein